MPVIRVQRIQASKSTLAADATVNTLYFMTALPADGTTAQTIATAIDAMFNDAVGAGSAIRFFMAETTMAANQNSYKFFNMDDTPPRVPFATPVAQNKTPMITTAALPAEVAICLSFRGPLASGVAAGRRRGRIYVGPLNTAAMEVDGLTGQARPAAALMTALIAGSNKLHDDLVAASINWCVYSPTARGAGAADLGCTPVTHNWVDNAFDTQRRRGPKASARTLTTL